MSYIEDEEGLRNSLAFVLVHRVIMISFVSFLFKSSLLIFVIESFIAFQIESNMIHREFRIM